MGLKFNPITGQLDFSGGGGVSGPSSSTDGAVALWDGTGGSTLKDSGITGVQSDNALLFPCAADDTNNAIELGTSGQGIGYNTSASRINLVMSSASKQLIANTFVRYEELLLINDSAQSATAPGISSPFATTTGISVTSGGNLYLIGAATEVAHITTNGMTMNNYFVAYNRTNANRGTAGTAGRIIFNTDDGQLNIDDGTNWTLPDGTTT